MTNDKCSVFRRMFSVFSLFLSGNWQPAQKSGEARQGRLATGNYSVPLCLFAFGFCVGLLGTGESASHWMYLARHLTTEVPVHRIFLPMYIPEGEAWVYRPLSQGILSSVFGRFTNPVLVLYFLKAVFLGAFCVSVYDFFTTLFKDDSQKKFIFAVSVASCILPSVLFSAWEVEEFDVAGTCFVFWAARYFILLQQENKPEILRCFVLFSLLSVLTKETTAVALLTLLFVIVFSGGYKLSRLSVRLFLFLFALEVCLFLPLMVFAKYPRKLLLGPTPAASFVFVVFHNAAQIFSFVFTSGALILLYRAAGCLISFNKGGALEEKKMERIGVFLLLILFSTSVLSRFSFYEAVFFAPAGRLYVLSFLLLASCYLLLKSQSGPFKICYAYILSFYAVITFVPLLLPYSREDVGGKVYIPLAPFVIFSVLESFRALYGQYGAFCKRVCVFFLACTAYYWLSGSVNFYLQHHSRVSAENKSKTFLSAFSPSNSVLFYTNFLFPSFSMDLRFLSGKPWGDIRAVFLNPHREENGTATKQEICLKAGKLKSGDVYIHVLGKKARVADTARHHFLTNSFRWLGGVGYDYLRFERGHSMLPWDFTLPDLEQHETFQKQTSLEAFLRLFKPAFSYKEVFYTFPEWVDDIPYRLLNGLPLILKYEARGEVYRIPYRDLGCK